MAAHYFSINRGKSGTKFSDITKGTSSEAADELELRVEDAPGWTRKEVIMALKSLIRVFEERGQSTFPPK